MRRYRITYHNKTADLLDLFETVAKSQNEAILHLRMKMRQNRVMFKIETLEVSK